MKIILFAFEVFLCCYKANDGGHIYAVENKKAVGLKLKVCLKDHH